MWHNISCNKRLLLFSNNMKSFKIHCSNMFIQFFIRFFIYDPYVDKIKPNKIL